MELPKAEWSINTDYKQKLYNMKNKIFKLSSYVGNNSKVVLINWISQPVSLVMNLTNKHWKSKNKGNQINAIMYKFKDFKIMKFLNKTLKKNYTLHNGCWKQYIWIKH